MINRLLFIALFIFISHDICAQENIPVGTWRSHFSYQEARLVELVGNQVYASTPFGLIFYDPDDNSLNKFSKIDGLSDVNITAISYDESIDYFSVGYANGNIDLIQDNSVLNITTLLNSDITQSKRINNIEANNGRVYMAIDFGVLVIDPNTGQINEAFQNLGPNGEIIRITDLGFSNDFIYLSTEIGVIRGPLTNNINLQDFNNWERFSSSIVDSVSFESLEVLENEIFAANDTAIFRFNGNNWSDLGFVLDQNDIVGIRATSQGIIVILSDGLQLIDNSQNISSLTIEEGDSPSDAIFAIDGSVWYTDLSNGLSRSLNDAIARFVPDGLYNSTTTRFRRVGDVIYAFPRPNTSAITPAMNGLGYAEFLEGEWKIVLPESINGFEDITDLVELDETTWVSSFGLGVQSTSEPVIYNDTNSPLINLDESGTSNQIIVTSMAEASDGSIWIANYSETPLLHWQPDGTWESFSFGVTASERPQNLSIDDSNQIWMVLNPFFGGGIIAFDPSSEESRYINASNGGLPTTRVTDLQIDKNGQVWIGTESGIAYFPFARGVIEDNSIDVIRPVFGNRFLLEDEFISAIAVDEGNRKWIGTTDGLWLFEDAGDRLVHNFTRDNSPLPSNNISDIIVHPGSGEVFVSTENGVISYRSDATRATSTHQNVSIFPNPVQPGYTGLIGISGLARDVTVKITNVSGRLVREINAAGGGASWDLADYNGNRAQSGVYLVFSSNGDGTETFVGKIAIIN